MKFLNLNFCHNVLNVAIVALPALEVFDWTPFVSSEMALKIVGGIGLAKILINAFRDGFTGMVKPQPPVT